MCFHMASWMCAPCASVAHLQSGARDRVCDAVHDAVHVSKQMVGIRGEKKPSQPIRLVAAVTNRYISLSSLSSLAVVFCHQHLMIVT